jgi:hypothetical protein
MAAVAALVVPGVAYIANSGSSSETGKGNDPTVTLAPTTPAPIATTKSPEVAPSSPSPSSPAPAISEPTEGSQRSYLADLDWIDRAGINPKAGSIRIGTTTYPQSVVMTCGRGAFVVYEAFAASRFQATIGIPNGTFDANDRVAEVTLYVDDQRITKTQDVIFGKPMPVSVKLQNASSLKISCTQRYKADNSIPNGYLDLGLGDAFYEIPA